MNYGERALLPGGLTLKAVGSATITATATVAAHGAFAEQTVTTLVTVSVAKSVLESSANPVAHSVEAEGYA
ncbi:hypothetical protein [Citrobacter portucalensis]|uniref:hypothetical protein n=1 Tax=Citrobacter portucalensis TaxID=1639133 RepID=UPI00226B4492|nr:hypothetical protein [Citrobacter portucalensis]MCX8986011.1 hypothetical protein [Citrobacter portucalensis]